MLEPAKKRRPYLPVLIRETEDLKKRSTWALEGLSVKPKAKAYAQLNKQGGFRDLFQRDDTEAVPTTE